MERESKNIKIDRKIIFGAMFIGLLVWFLDALTDYYFFTKGSFSDNLIFNLSDHEIFMRFLTVLFFLIFGFILSQVCARQREAEDKLEESNFKLRTIADFTYNWEYWLGKDGSYKYVSPAFERITGYLREELVQDPSLIKKIIHPDDYDHFEKHFEDETTNSLEISQLDFKILTQNKEEKTIRHRCQPIYDENGRFIGTRGSNFVIPPQAEELIKTSQQLGERVKELNCLYEISRKMVQPNCSIKEILKATLDVLLSSWQYPEITGARLTYNGWTVKSDNWKETKWIQSADIVNVNGSTGKVEVCYTEEKPELDEGPFLNEERKLIDAIGILLGDFIQRKEVEDTLSFERKRLKGILESMVDGVTITDMSGRILSMNKAAAKQFGYTEKEVVGKTLGEVFLAPEEMSKFVNAVKEMVFGGKTIAEEYIGKRKDGTSFPLSVSLSVLKDDEGNPAATIVIHRDISRRKRNEFLQNALYQISEASEKAESLDDLYKSVHEIIGSAMPANNFFIASYDDKKDKLSFDYFVDEIDDYQDFIKPGRGFTAYVLRTGKPLFLDEATEKRLLETGEVENVGTRSPIWLGVPLIIEGKTIGAIVVQHYSDPNAYSKDDLHLLGFVSSQIAQVIVNKRKEAELRNSEEAFRGFYENSTLGIYRSTPGGKIILANPTAISLLGYANFEELSNIKTADGFIDPSERKRFDEIMEREEVVYGFEIKWQKGDGSLIDLSESARAVKDENGNLIYYEGIIEDITDRKRAESALVEAKEKAEEMSRLKSNLLANVSHELRTPLIGITGYSEMLKDELEDPERKQMAESILTSGIRLTKTLDLILDLSLFESDSMRLKLEKVNIVNVINEIVDSYEFSEIKDGVDFNFESQSNYIECMIDRNALSRMVNYLLDNAIKFTHEGSINIKLFSDDKNVVMQITDTGVGIPKEKMNVIFNPFRQVSEGNERLYEGTGLGLTLTSKYAKLLKGKISLESKPSKGTTVTIKFPSIKHFNDNGGIKHHEKRTGTAISNINGRSMPGALLIESEPASVEIAKYFLKDICSIDAVDNGREAIILSLEKKYDAVIVDLDLAGDIDGEETIKEIRKLESYKHIPIIAITSFTGMGIKEKLLSIGCSDYISKPFKRTELTRHVNRLLNQAILFPDSQTTN